MFLECPLERPICEGSGDLWHCLFLERKESCLEAAWVNLRGRDEAIRSCHHTAKKKKVLTTGCSGPVSLWRLIPFYHLEDLLCFTVEIEEDISWQPWVSFYIYHMVCNVTIERTLQVRRPDVQQFRELSSTTWHDLSWHDLAWHDLAWPGMTSCIWWV